MIEEEWLTGNNPTAMLNRLRTQGIFSSRKARLLAVAVWRQAPDWEEENEVFEIAERYADGLATLDEVLEAFEDNSDEWLQYYAEGGVAFREDNWPATRPKQAYFLREMFGNPFRPVLLDPAWLTSDVLALARGIYAERAFDRMPILADALQDAGCANEEVLNHCRDANVAHVRGCWVVDLLLGKS